MLLLVRAPTIVKLVLAAVADISAGALCRIKLPVRVPIGFHATWVPGERLPGGSA